MFKLKSSLMAGAALSAMLPSRAGDGATAIASSVTSLEGVPEALHAFYVEKDGKFTLQVTGLPTQENVSRLEEGIRKERADHKATKDTLARLTNNGARQVDDIVADLDRIPELEATQGQIDEAKLEQLVEARISKRLAPVERERDQLKTQLGEKDTLITDFQAKDRTRTIHDKVREDATKAKLLPEAVEDALLLADRVFEVDDGGRVVTKDNVGVTPGIEPGAWLTDIQKSRPHWWGPSTGGGAGGQRGGGTGTQSNPFSAEGWNLTEQGALVQSDPAKADQLAKLAGTTVGGPRPMAKK